ncbi:hypothetical protein OAH36_03820 [Verrucomicrobia bacterium]|nr:hypothetical protein [Verrucomicrobiota bacterium]MDB4746290.1 hypothetical protein [Verrucomicrobiota bacterium]MDB4798706.1 hypothetical protein [Verrucomicrobiota bacterium]
MNWHPFQSSKFFSRPKRVLGGLLFVSTGLILIWCFYGRPYESQILPDGSLLTVHRLQYGRQIEVVDGSAVLHWLRSLIPKGGLHIGPLSMRSPSAQVLGTPGGDEFLFLELDTISKSGSLSMLATPSIYGDHRGVIVDENGIAYPQSFRDTDRSRSGDFGMFLCPVFPRSSERLIFHVQQRQWRDSPWKTLASLSFPNPALERGVNWEQLTEVTTVETNGWSFSIGEVLVMPNPKDLPDLWVPIVRLPFSMVRDDQQPNGWVVAGLEIEDPKGNHLRYQGQRYSIEQGVTLSGRAVPDPNLMWKVIVHFERGFAPWTSDVARIALPPVSSTPTNIEVEGIPVTIRRDSASYVLIGFPGNRSDLGLRLGEWGPGGKRSFRMPNRSGMQNEFYYPIPAEESGREDAMLEFGIVPTPTVTFFVRPQLIGVAPSK